MTWTPQLNVVCNRCGKPRGLLRHDCISSSRRKASIKPQVTFGKCPACKKTVSNPLTHTCVVRTDFKKRKAAAGRSRPKQPEKHDYQACSDQDCPRPLCTAFKAGWKQGYDAGYEDGYSVGFERGYKEGYDKGFPDGIDACPRPHKYG